MHYRPSTPDRSEPGCLHRILSRGEWRNRYGGLMDDLDAYAVEAYAHFKRETAMHGIAPSGPEAGKRIADMVTGGWGRGEDLFLDFDPELVAGCFANGDAASQIALYKMSMRLEHRGVFHEDEQARH